MPLVILVLVLITIKAGPNRCVRVAGFRFLPRLKTGVITTQQHPPNPKHKSQNQTGAETPRVPHQILGRMKSAKDSGK